MVQMKKKNLHKKINYLLPIISILLVAGFLIYSKPGITGQLILDPGKRIIDADVVLTTRSSELVPENAEIVVAIDNQQRNMSIKDFISKTGSDFIYETKKEPKLDYEGYGYTGNFTYRLNISQFNLNLTVKPGEHSIKTQIVFYNRTLYEKVEKVMIK